MEYVDLYPEILGHVSQCSEPLAEQQVRKAVREFCKRTEFLKIESLPKLNRVANQPAYSVTDPQGSNIVRVLEVWDEDRKLRHKSPDQLELEARGGPRTVVFRASATDVDINQVFGDPWESMIGAPQFWTATQANNFQLVPVPDTSLVAALKVVVAVQPSLASTGVADFIIDNWYEVIVSGALALLYAIPKKDWSDNTLSAYHRELFSVGTGKALADRLAGFESNDHVVGRTRAYP